MNERSFVGTNVMVLMVLVLALLVELARAEVGHSFIGMCSESFPCEAAHQMYAGEESLGFGFVLNTFHPYRCHCASVFLADPRAKIFRAHLVNGTCFKERQRECQSFEAFYGLTIAEAERRILRSDPVILGALRASAIRLRKMAEAAVGEVRCLASPVLEAPFGVRARKVLLEAVAPYLEGRCELVDNPLSGECVSGYLCERHGRRAVGDILDLDGEDALKLDIPRYLRKPSGKVLKLLWTRSYNLIDHHNPDFVPPAKRTLAPNRFVLAHMARYHRTGAGILPPKEPYDRRDLRGCREFRATRDGPGGFTFKASDSRRGVALVLPRTQQRGVYEPVEAFKRGRRIAELRFSALLREDGRPIYRSSVPQARFPVSTVLRQGGVCWKLAYGQHRTD